MRIADRIIAAYRRCWNRQVVAAIVAVGAFLLVLFGIATRNAEVLGLTGENWAQIACAIMFGVVVFSWINYRCPACNTYLGKHVSLRLSRCRSCGAPLTRSKTDG
jgi:hypothetical protein